MVHQSQLSHPPGLGPRPRHAQPSLFGSVARGADRVEKLAETVIVILMCQRPPARTGLGANAPQVLQRTAELVPNQLKFSAPRTIPSLGPLHRSPAANHCSTAVDKCPQGRTLRQRGARIGASRSATRSTASRRSGGVPAGGPRGRAHREAVLACTADQDALSVASRAETWTPSTCP